MRVKIPVKYMLRFKFWNAVSHLLYRLSRRVNRKLTIAEDDIFQQSVKQWGTD